ncbi:MAG: patatin-like phospholipase family protein [candidate division KSB1 bacterium]|nr:patatin-like phospholipase family protein [candidate division KSB1 bacterium]
MQTEKKVGLALSGGAVLGIAHLGVIKVLEAYHIPIHYVAGTSAGSLVGAFLAAGYSFAQMWEIAQELSWGKIGGVTIPKMGLLNSKLLERYIEKKMGKRNFSDLVLPFAAVAVDITTGKEFIFTEGRVAEGVRASCIIPGLLTPLEKNGTVYVDGGLRNFLPVDVVRRMGADYVIAVKLIPSINQRKKPENILEIMLNSFELTVRGIAENSPGGDVDIVPDLDGLNSYDFEQREELLKRGEEAALTQISRIVQDLREVPRVPGFWERLRKKVTGSALSEL